MGGYWKQWLASHFLSSIFSSVWTPRIAGTWLFLWLSLLLFLLFPGISVLRITWSNRTRGRRAVFSSPLHYHKRTPMYCGCKTYSCIYRIWRRGLCARSASGMGWRKVSCSHAGGIWLTTYAMWLPEHGTKSSQHPLWGHHQPCPPPRAGGCAFSSWSYRCIQHCPVHKSQSMGLSWHRERAHCACYLTDTGRVPHLFSRVAGGHDPSVMPWSNFGWRKTLEVLTWI